MGRGLAPLVEDADLLHALVAVDSVTGDTERAVSAFVDACRARRLAAHRDAAGNAVAVAGRGPREILLVGHIDTVAPPLPVRREGGWLHGRGAVDAKGPLAAFACAAARFLDCDTHRLVVVGACDEEGPSNGARHLLDKHRPEALVIGEPSGTNGVTLGYKGIVKIRYEVEDDLQHTGAPHPSVPDRGLAFWHAVQMYLGQRHGDSMFEMPTVKLNEFHTELLPSGRVRARLSGSTRTPPGFDTPAFLGFLRERAGPAAKLDVPEWAPAWLGEKNALLTRAFVGAIRDEGLAPRYVRKTGTSDANLLAPVWRCPTVAYGPGDSTLDHTPHERIEIADFERSVRVLERALRAIVTAAPA
ncbi:MAG: [amino group carrier protein]-lysine/ornithine hydrolase [Thermoplasmata archaeon]|jgi:LysW-gamma-L-lysine carboxypeptidase|nr:[amino group carrier protein]-lysine/ornithine hydrolase [Thermoplasmata archaeon]